MGGFDLIGSLRGDDDDRIVAIDACARDQPAHDAERPPIICPSQLKSAVAFQALKLHKRHEERVHAFDLAAPWESWLHNWDQSDKGNLHSDLTRKGGFPRGWRPD